MNGDEFSTLALDVEPVSPEKLNRRIDVSEERIATTLGQDGVDDAFRLVLARKNCAASQQSLADD